MSTPNEQAVTEKAAELLRVLGLVPTAGRIELLKVFADEAAHAARPKRPCIDCGVDVTDGEFDICPVCEEKFHEMEERDQ